MTKEFHFCPTASTQVGLSHGCLPPQPSHQGPWVRPGKAGWGLSTYLAPRRKRFLLGAEASILCSPLQQGLWSPSAVGNAGVGQPAASPSYSRHSGLVAAEGGARVATQHGRRIQPCGCEGTGSEPTTGRSGRASVWAPVHPGGSGWHSALRPAHPRKALSMPLGSALTKALGAWDCLGTGTRSKAAASSGGAPKGMEVGLHGQSVLLEGAEKSPEEGEATSWPRLRAPVPSACLPLLAQGQPIQPPERCYQGHGSPRACALQASGKAPPRGSSWAKGRPGPIWAWHKLLGGGAHGGWDNWKRERGRSWGDNVP